MGSLKTPRERYRLRTIRSARNTPKLGGQKTTRAHRTRTHRRHRTPTRNRYRLISCGLAMLLCVYPGTARASSNDQYLDRPPLHWWYALAKCETGWGPGQRPRWTRNTGTYEGGLGIHRATWNDYTRGDRLMPDRGGDATVWQQIEVAMRIARHGWYDRTRNVRVPSVGFYGWGCAKHSVGDPRGILKSGKRSKLYDPRKLTTYATP